MIVGQRQSSSLNMFHFLDGIFLGQWYPEEFLARSVVKWGSAGAPRKRTWQAEILFGLFGEPPHVIEEVHPFPITSQSKDLGHLM